MIQIEHFETGIKTFENNVDFLNFTQTIFIENEDWTNMSPPSTFDECKAYINEYCDNLMVNLSVNINIPFAVVNYLRSVHKSDISDKSIVDIYTAFIENSTNKLINNELEMFELFIEENKDDFFN